MGTIDKIDELEPVWSERDIIEKFERIDRLVASAIADLDRFDRCGGWAVTGAPTLRSWLRSRCRRTSVDANQLVKMMQALRSLPRTSEAFAAGRLARGHVQAVSTHLNDEILPIFADGENDLVPLLADRSVDAAAETMRVWSARANVVVGRDGREPGDHTDMVHLSVGMNGTFHLSGTLTQDNGETVKAALAACTAQPVEGEPLRSFGQRQADALAEMARRVLQVTDTSASFVTDITLLVDARDLAAGRIGMYADGTVVAPANVKRLLCDAVVTPLLQGDAGKPLWLGRSVRTVTKEQRRALVARDRHCGFPDCRRPPAWCQAHHVREFVADDGPTDIDNLVLLCHYHHKLLHRADWHAKLDQNHLLHITTPTGQVLRARPPNEPSVVHRTTQDTD